METVSDLISNLTIPDTEYSYRYKLKNGYSRRLVNCLLSMDGDTKLINITKKDFMNYRNAGIKTWTEFQKQINNGI